jgi:hypothetical protein
MSRGELSMAESGVDGVTVLQSGGHPTLEECGGMAGARTFAASQLRPLKGEGVSDDDNRD